MRRAARRPPGLVEVLLLIGIDGPPILFQLLTGRFSHAMKNGLWARAQRPDVTEHAVTFAGLLDVVRVSHDGPVGRSSLNNFAQPTSASTSGSASFWRPHGQGIPSPRQLGVCGQLGSCAASGSRDRRLDAFAL